MNIYQHFRAEEREYIDQVLNWKNYVDRQYAAKLTDFLDPREQHILKTIIGETGEVKCSFFGGSLNTERKRALLHPDYLTASEDEFQISLFEVRYPKKFVTIDHRQVLGTLMSLGLTRGKFGDILLDDKRIQFFAAKEVRDYLAANMESIGSTGVKLEETSLDDSLAKGERWEEAELTVSSLRLDTVISAVHHISRQKSQLLIQQGLAKVNWVKVENFAFLCDVEDLISVRGYGRAKILRIDGRTKKEKWRITAGKQK